MSGEHAGILSKIWTDHFLLVQTFCSQELEREGGTNRQTQTDKQKQADRQVDRGRTVSDKITNTEEA